MQRMKWMAIVFEEIKTRLRLSPSLLTVSEHLKPYQSLTQGMRGDQLEDWLPSSSNVSGLPFPGFPPLVTADAGMVQPRPDTDIPAVCLQSNVSRNAAWFKLKTGTD